MFVTMLPPPVYRGDPVPDWLREARLALVLGHVEVEIPEIAEALGTVAAAPGPAELWYWLPAGGGYELTAVYMGDFDPVEAV